MTTVALHAVAGEQLTRADLEQLVEMWQHRLGFDRWGIRIDWAVPAADAAAEIKPWHVYDYATIRFNQTAEKGFQTWSRTIANRNVVHELLHLALRDVDYAVETGELVMSTPVWKLFEANVDNACEAAIDRLATVIVDLAGAV